MALRLHAVTTVDGPHSAEHLRSGARLVPVRELSAVVTDQTTFAAPPVTPQLIVEHREIVDGLFLAAAVLPAPPGVVFRSEETLSSWIALHYVSLSDALAFVEDRHGARVHICRDETCDPADYVGVDLAAAAAEAFRGLRRKAVAAVPLRVEHFTGLMLSGAFLVERDLWGGFRDTVEELSEQRNGLSYTMSGPWAPYDFVRLQVEG